MVVPMSGVDVALSVSSRAFLILCMPITTTHNTMKIWQVKENRTEKGSRKRGGKKAKSVSCFYRHERRKTDEVIDEGTERQVLMSVGEDDAEPARSVAVEGLATAQHHLVFQ